MKKLLTFLFILPLIATALEVDFTIGKPKKFYSQLLKNPQYIQGKGLTGSGNGRIIGSGLTLDASDISVVEVYTGGEKIKFAKLYFADDGRKFAEKQMIRGKLLSDRIIFVTAGNANWQGKIGAIRIDLAAADGNITIKKILIPENNSAIPASVNFTSGVMYGWRLTLSKKKVTALPKQGIVFNSTNRERLISPDMTIDSTKCDMLHMTAAGEFTTVKLYFTSGKEAFTESKMVRGKRNGNILTFDMGKNRLWKGEITNLRFDIHAPVGSKLEIKRLDFSKGEGPNALNSPWSRPTKIAPGKTVSGGFEVLHPLPVACTYQTSGKVTIAVDYRDIYGKVLRSSEVDIQGKGAWELSFVPQTARLDFRIRNNGNASADFQMKAMVVPENKTSDKTVYSVKLADVPVNSTENTTWTPQVTFTPALPAGRNFTLLINGEKKIKIIAADVDTTKETTTLTADKLHFAYLAAGKYTISAEVDGTACQMANYTIDHTIQRKFALPQVKIDRSGSRPYYVINGKEKVNTMEYLGSDPPLSKFAYRQIFNAVDYGVNGIRLRVIFRFDGEKKVTFKEVDDALQTILMRRPHVNIMFHVSVTDPGPKWRGAHPEEGIRNIDGNFRIRNYRKTPEATSSMASRRWVEDSVTMLKALTEHLKTLPASERVIGILPCSGITWEWLHWGSAQGEWVDYSEHYRQFFISYLRKIYHNDIAKLNTAWQSQYTKFEDIQIPRPERRLAADHIEFRTPSKFQPEIDLTDSLSYLISDVILTLCRSVKEAADDKLLSGTYYGYSIYLNAARRAHETGHFALYRLLQAKEVDILMGPSRYAGRAIGGATGFMYPEGSLNLHNKLNISECDDRPINADSATGRADTVAGSRAALERAYGLQNSGFSVMRWFDFSKGWVMAEPRMLDVVKKLSEFDEKVGKLTIPAMPSAATAAVFSSERTAAMLKPDSRLQMMLLQNGYEALAASGMSFTFFDINDIAQAEKDRKLLMFINCFRLSDAEKAAVKKIVAKPNRVYFFTSGIGLLADGKLSTAFMKEIFGCDFEHSPDRKVREATAVAAAQKLLGFPRGTRLRTAFECGDIFYPKGKNVIPLAKTADGKTALAAIRKNGSLFIYCAYPALTPELCSKVAQKADLPLIRAGKAAVWYNGGYGTVHTAKPVTATVELPANFKGITEFPDMKFIPAKDGKVSKKLPAESTWLFYLVK